MTIRLLLTIITTFFVTTTSFGQTEEDNIEFLRVQNQINEGNYRKALDVLSNISEQGRTSAFYISYKATCYEKLAIYDSAAITYKQLYDKTKSFDAMKKVAEMKDKDEAKKNCPKCHGTGSYYETIKCQVCKNKGAGNGTFCLLCDGSGKCYSCKGKGYHESTGVTCQYCSDGNGNGKCPDCRGSGRGTYKCYNCNGTGNSQKLVYCYH